MATLSNLSSDVAEGPAVLPAARPLPPPTVAVAVGGDSLAAASADFEDDGAGEGAPKGALQYHRDSHDVDHSLEEQVPSPFIT
jgi:hypothetical protein